VTNEPYRGGLGGAFTFKVLLHEQVRNDTAGFPACDVLFFLGFHSPPERPVRAHAPCSMHGRTTTEVAHPVPGDGGGPLLARPAHPAVLPTEVRYSVYPRLG